MPVHVRDNPSRNRNRRAAFADIAQRHGAVAPMRGPNRNNLSVALAV
jgi:hypothetical protein